MAEGRYKIVIGSNTFKDMSGVSRIIDFDYVQSYNDLTTLLVELDNFDNIFDTGGTYALSKGDTVELYLLGEKDLALTRYLYGEIHSIEHKDNGVTVVECRDCIVKGEDQAPDHVFFENFIDNENFYEEGVGRVINLTNSPVYAAGDSVLEPPVKVQYIIDKVPRATKRDGSQGDFSAASNRPIFQRFTTGVNMTTQNNIHCRIMFRKPNAGVPQNTYRVGICPEDSNGDPDIANLIYGDTVSWVDAGPWVKFEDFEWSGSILEPNAYYFLFIQVYSGATFPDDVYVGKAYVNPYSELCFAYNGATYPESPGSWVFALVVDVAESFKDLNYNADYTIDQTNDLIDCGPDFIPDAKGASTEHWPYFFRVSLYFKDDTTVANKQNIKDVIAELFKIGWGNLTQVIAAAFDSDANYRLPLFVLSGLTINEALRKIGLHAGKLTGGREAQIYTDYSGGERLHFNTAAVISDAAVKGFNHDNPVLEAGGTKNADYPSGSVLSLDLKKMGLEQFSRVRVTPQDMENIVEVNKYGIFPDYIKLYEEKDNSLLTYEETMARAEMILEALAFDEYEGMLRVEGYYPAFSGGRPIACGDIIALKSTKRGITSSTKFKIVEVRITTDNWTEFMITRQDHLKNLLKKNSDRIKDVERFTSPTELQDIVITVRTDAVDACPNVNPQYIYLENAVSGVALHIALAKRTVQTGHNHYQAYFYPWWNAHADMTFSTPIIELKLIETVPRHTYDLQDLAEEQYLPYIFKWSAVRVVVNWDVGTA